MRFFADYLRADFAVANLKGGSGGGNNTTVTNQTAVNPLAQQAYQTAINTGTNVAQTPYPTYNSPLVAGFNPTQQAAFSNINNAAGVAQPYIGQAANLIQASTSGINPAATVGQYMSPYTNDVVQGLQNVQNQQNAAQQTQLVGQAVGAGAFGGDRAQIAQSMLAGQQALGENPAISQALQSGYSQALNTGLSSQEANAWLASQGAFGLANLGQEAQNTALGGANAQLQAGGLEQQLAQEQLSVPYGQFQAAQAYPYQISNMELGLATGAGGAGGTATTTSPGPSAISQLTGLGLTGIGLANTGAFSGLGNLFGSGSTSPYAVDPATGNFAADATGSGFVSGQDATLNPFLNTGAFGGRIPHRALGGALHYDDGGALPLSLGPSAGGISPVTQSGLGSGNPMYGGALNQLSGLPTEKLQELQARIPPGSPQGGIVQAVLRRRQMMPQSDPSAALQAPAAASPMQGLGGLPGLPGMGMADGGDVGDSADVDPILLDPYLSPATAGAPTANDLTYQRAPLVGPIATRPDIPGLGSSPSLGPPAVASVSPADQTAADASASDAARKNAVEYPVGLSSPPRAVAPWTPQPAALGNVTGTPQGYLDITGQAENSGHVHGGGPMTSSGQARGLYQITDGTWHDFAPKAGVDLTKFPNADSADKDTQTAVANIIPIQRWDPRTVAKLQASYPDMDPTKPLGSLAGAEAADLDARSAQGHGTTVAEDTIEEAAPQKGSASTALGAPHGGNWMSSPGAALLTAGLGILGGRSPFASENIGQGALEGLKFAQQAHGQEAQIADTQARIAQTGDYQKGELALRALGLSQQAAAEKATQAYRQGVLEQGRYTNTPWQQPDPNDPSKIITGIMRTSTRGDEPPQFTPTQGLPVNKADPSAVTFNANAATNAPAAHGDDYLKTLPPNIGTQVKALAEGRMAFPTGFALKSPYWQNMLSAVSTYDPSFDAVNYNARNKARADFTSGKSAQNITSFNTAIGHLGTLSDAAAALNNTNWPTYNTVANYVSRQSGDPRVVQFNLAKNAVADEMTRAFRGSGGSEAEVERWEGTLSASQSPEQLQAAVKQGVHLLESRINAVGEQYQRGMGTAEQPIKLLSTDAQKTMARLDPDYAGAPKDQAPAKGATSSVGASGPPAPAIDFLRTHARNADGSVNSDLLSQFKQKYGADPAQYINP